MVRVGSGLPLVYSCFLSFFVHGVAGGGEAPSLCRSPAGERWMSCEVFTLWGGALFQPGLAVLRGEFLEVQFELTFQFVGSVVVVVVHVFYVRGGVVCCQKCDWLQRARGIHRRGHGDRRGGFTLTPVPGACPLPRRGFLISRLPHLIRMLLIPAFAGMTGGDLLRRARSTHHREHGEHRMGNLPSPQPPYRGMGQALSRERERG